MNLWHDVDPRPSKDFSQVTCVIEIPLRSRTKYELDESGRIKLDRVLYTWFIYPFNYGFVPRSVASDGDAYDVVVLATEAFHPGILVNVRLIGMLRLLDEGIRDDKLVAVALRDPTENVTDVRQLSLETKREITHFFTHYKDLEGKKVRVLGWSNASAARKEMKAAFLAYEKRFGQGKTGKTGKSGET